MHISVLVRDGLEGKLLDPRPGFWRQSKENLYPSPLAFNQEGAPQIVDRDDIVHLHDGANFVKNRFLFSSQHRGYVVLKEIIGKIRLVFFGSLPVWQVTQ